MFLLINCIGFGQDFAEIYFRNQTEGLKIFRDRNLNKYILSNSNDGGTTWGVLLTGNKMKAIAYPSSNKILVGLETKGVAVSENKGVDWSYNNFGDSQINIRQIQFINSSYGWICSEKAVYITNDGGVTWDATGLSKGWYDALAIYVRGIDDGWLVKENGDVFRFNPSGGADNWSQIGTLGGRCYGNNAGISFADSLVGYAVGYNYSYKSTDGGYNWKTIPQASYRNINGYFVMNKQEIFLCGLKGILYSSSGGENFVTVYYDGVEIQSIHFSDTQYGWAIDNDDNIIKTTDGGQTWAGGNSNQAFPPSITSIIDKPNDEGGFVILEFERSMLDGINNSEVLINYSIYSIIHNNAIFLKQVNPTNSTHYTVELPTVGDSTASGIIWSYYRVDAVTQLGNNYKSQIESGYSVDNLSPQPPSNLNGTLKTNRIELTWKQSPSIDVTHYQIFRSSNELFTVDTLNFFYQVDDTVFTDTDLPFGEADSLYYSVCAVDAAGNRSVDTVRVAIPLNTTSVKEISIPNEFYLHQNYPNPFNPGTIIEFTLPRSARVKLVVYNTKGELIRKLTDTNYSMGKHSIQFDASNLSSGVYFYRLTYDNFSITKKMLLLR